MKAMVEMIHVNPPNHCSQAGAFELKARLEQYWNQRGYKVRVSVAEAGFRPALRAASFELRSDMVNGLPAGALAARRESQVLSADAGGIRLA